jgi:hypothetical protein
MKKKIGISLAAVAALLLAMLAVNLAMATTAVATKTNLATATATRANVMVEAQNGVAISAEQGEDVEKLKELTPATIEEAEASIYPIRNRFLMWTHDGVHIMWGVYGNGRFVGTDNLGKRCWGIYGRGIFAGFYDGEFFWGKYDSGMWKAQYLFGLENSYGKYVTFPQPTVTSTVP